MAEKKGSNWLFWLIVGALAFYIYSHYFNNGETPIAYAKTFKESLQKFNENVKDTKTVLNEAFQKYKEAKDVLFKYQDERTKQFIEEWQKANKKAEDLIDSYNNLLKTADNFFSILKKEAAKIKDEKLRTKIYALIEKKEDEFYKKADEARQSIKRILVIIQKGNDIIKAIEIAGALKNADLLLEEDNLINEMNRTFATLSQLTKEGETLINELVNQ
jgi:dsDNA-binding SOS-regulon protein